jgi:tRNA-2-methylthio-N6-dimethylallyladenosine synthase
LLGQNVNAYNFQTKKLADLILEISKISGLKRIRYTTSHPRDFTDDLIMAHQKCEKLMPLIHLPVQSGSDKILNSMNRKHTIKEYLDVIKKLKKANSNIKFSSDFIIGYPGEDFSDFQKTINLMQEVKFINSYSFIYSARPGTPAYNFKPIDQKEAKSRLMHFKISQKKLSLTIEKI